MRHCDGWLFFIPVVDRRCQRGRPGIWGNQGNLFSTSGDADVYGYVTGLAQRTTSTSQAHSFGNSTTFDLSELPDGYDPSAGRTDDDEDDDPGGGGGSPSGVSLRWSRFR